MRSSNVTPETTDFSVYIIDVEYRPKGYVNYVGDTKYDGWTAMMLDRKQDGTLLDGQGNALLAGNEPVYLPFEVYNDIDFRNLDFGSLVSESELVRVAIKNYDDIFEEIMDSEQFSTSLSSAFLAPRRQRQMVKIVLSEEASSVRSDKWGTRLSVLNINTPHIDQVIEEYLYECLRGVFEGRYSMKSVSGRNSKTFIDLNDVLVGCTPNFSGEESRFKILREYLSIDQIEELALKLMSNYAVNIEIVRGDEFGFFVGCELDNS